MSSDFFHGLMRWNVERNGTVRCLPYLYYDNLSMAAIYTAATAKVRKLIPHPKLFPIEVLPGRCLVAFAAFEYRKTDVEPYNEVSVSFLVSHERKPFPLITLAQVLGSRTIPSYVWQLPVTTEHARAGGVDLFGFPKFLADIQFLKDDKQVTCKLSTSGVEIFRLVGRLLPTRPSQPVRYITYALDGESLVLADILVNRLEYAESYERNSVQLVIGDGHPVCNTLREIGLANRPMLYQYSPKNEAVLFPARNVGDI